MAMDYNDDGYIEEQEWLALKELNLKKLMKQKSGPNSSISTPLLADQPTEIERRRALLNDSEKMHENVDHIGEIPKDILESVLKKAFEEVNKKYISFLDFEELINLIEIDPKKAIQQVINQRYKDS